MTILAMPSRPTLKTTSETSTSTKVKPRASVALQDVYFVCRRIFWIPLQSQGQARAAPVALLPGVCVELILPTGLTSTSRAKAVPRGSQIFICAAVFAAPLDTVPLDLKTMRFAPAPVALTALAPANAGTA